MLSDEGGLGPIDLDGTLSKSITECVANANRLIRMTLDGALTFEQKLAVSTSAAAWSVSTGPASKAR